jgi:hypothetical protein
MSAFDVAVVMMFMVGTGSVAVVIWTFARLQV